MHFCCSFHMITISVCDSANYYFKYNLAPVNQCLSLKDILNTFGFQISVLIGIGPILRYNVNYNNKVCSLKGFLFYLDLTIYAKTKCIRVIECFRKMADCMYDALFKLPCIKLFLERIFFYKMRLICECCLLQNEFG